MLNVQLSAESGALRIACQGALEAGTIERFVETAARALERDEATVVADLSDLLHLDSSGVGALSHLFRRLAQAGRRLVVEGLRGQPLALLRATGLDRILAGASRTRAPARPMLPARGLARGV